MRFVITCLFSSVIISIILSFSSSAKTYLNFEIRISIFVTYGGGEGILNDLTRVASIREDGIKAVNELTVVDQASAIFHLVLVE